MVVDVYSNSKKVLRDSRSHLSKAPYFQLQIPIAICIAQCFN